LDSFVGTKARKYESIAEIHFPQGKEVKLKAKSQDNSKRVQFTKHSQSQMELIFFSTFACFKMMFLRKKVFVESF